MATRLTSRLARWSIVIAGVLAAAPRGSATPACPPTAIIDGPEAIAKPIISILRQHGVRAESSACANQTVRAFVSERSDSNGFPLRIEDRFGALDCPPIPSL